MKISELLEWQNPETVKRKEEELKSSGANLKNIRKNVRRELRAKFERAFRALTKVGDIKRRNLLVQKYAEHYKDNEATDDHISSKATHLRKLGKENRRYQKESITKTLDQMGLKRIKKEEDKWTYVKHIDSVMHFVVALNPKTQKWAYRSGEGEELVKGTRFKRLLAQLEQFRILQPKRKTNVK